MDGWRLGLEMIDILVYMGYDCYETHDQVDRYKL